MFLLGGSTYRVASIRGTRVNVTPATGYRPTIPSWTGEANSRTHELSQAVLKLLGHVSVGIRMGEDSEPLLMDALGLNKPVALALKQFLDEHSATTFQVPSNDRILVEQVEAPLPTYVVTTCRGRSFNLALGYLFAGIAAKDNVIVHELSFDENGFMAKLSHEVEISKIPDVFRNDTSEELSLIHI